MSELIAEVGVALGGLLMVAGSIYAVWTDDSVSTGGALLLTGVALALAAIVAALVVED